MDRLGKYELRAVLGRGAMGTVYEGWDPVIARRVAIKTVRQPDDADSEEREQLDRFQQEAQAAGRLHHPNIVGVFDYAETGEIAYIVMEFVAGRSLKAVLDAGAVPLAEIGPLMDGLLSGLEYSHAHQVIHRDIKPANVIVTADGAIKIADFGIARIGSSTMTQAGTIMGTPAYMSPEQFQGGAIDQRTDIYSAGVLLYQLLTGRRPFEGNMATIMHDVLTGPAPVPSAVHRTVSPALDGVVARAMSRAPADRFPDAGAFNQALQRALRAPALPAGLGDLADEDATVVTSTGGAKAGGTRQVKAGQSEIGATPSSTAAAQTASPPRDASPRRQGWLLPAAAAVLLVLGSGGGYWVWQGRVPARQADKAPGDREASGTGATDHGGQGQNRDAPDGNAPNGDTRDRTAQNETARDQGKTVPDIHDQAGRQQDNTNSAKPPEPAADGKDHRDASNDAGTTGGPGPIIQGTIPPGSDTGRRPDQVKPPDTQSTDNTGSGTRPDVVTREDSPRPPPVRPPAVMRSAVADALRRAPCTAVTGELRPSGVIALRGVIADGLAASTLRDAVADAAPGAPTDWSLSEAEGPYCTMLDLVRPLLRPFGSEARTVGLTLRDGKTDLVADDLMFPVISLPDVPSYMQVDYIASDNSVAHLVNAVPGPAIPANTLRTLGEPKPPFPGYIVDKPFGTDMLVVFASNAPLFRTARPESEKADVYLPLLRNALDAAQRNGMRTWAAVVMVRTLPKPKF